MDLIKKLKNILRANKPQTIIIRIEHFVTGEVLSERKEQVGLNGKRPAPPSEKPKPVTWVL